MADRRGDRVTAAFLGVGVGAVAAASLGRRPSASQSILGERTQPLEFTINPQNVSQLMPKWVFTMKGSQGESATATVADGVVYFPCCGGGTASVGSWAALNPLTGAFDWQTPVPGNYAALGPVSEANGVMYGKSMDGSATDPDMFALDAATGKILWGYDAGSSVIAGPAIVDGTVYWGAGYTHLGLPMFTGNNKFYAFSLNGK